MSVTQQALPAGPRLATAAIRRRARPGGLYDYTIQAVARLTSAATLRASFECEAEITARARRQLNHVSVLKGGFYAQRFLEDYSFWSRLGRPSTDRKDSLLRAARPLEPRWRGPIDDR